MQAKGRCHCGAISYAVGGEPVYHALCHCSDCRRATGAPGVSWALFAREAVTIAGEPKAYASSEQARRHFCGDCGTSLFYTNESVFPGQIDVQSATLDDPGVLPLQCHIQTAERIVWMEHPQDLPQFERYPAGPEG
ncbi:MAG: GFA family protein [Novosphingobium sp.]|nr:MAG: GFA family protein [Novosphingobium sp.]